MATLDAAAQGNGVVTRAVNEINRYEFFANGQVALMATDMKTGEVIAEVNPDMSIIPASNTKLFTTAAALDLLGPDYTYKTELAYSGKIDSSGMLKGNLIIRGGGDPTLGSRFFADHPNYNYNELFIEAIQKAGIKNIGGNIIGDGTVYNKETTPPTWAWEDLGNYFGAVPNGLTVNDNMMTLHFKTGRDGTEPIYMGSEPIIKGMNLSNLTTASEHVTRENTNVFGKAYQLSKYIEGPMPINKNDVTVRCILPDPPLFVATQLKDSLMSRGISVFGQPLSAADNARYRNQDTSATVICTLESPPLSEIIKYTNWHSINLYAEHCLLLVGQKWANSSNVAVSAASVMQFWKSKGMDIKGMSINDGCGLSHFNIVTARQMCYMLTYMHNTSQYYDAFNNSLTMCGDKGTMSGMCLRTRAEKNARGKSGTMRRVKSYSGYVTSRSGREIAWAIIINNFTCSSNDTRKMMEKFIVSLADYNN
ncbi:MAG: D-alanyl-D-alanine carboxypeptidase/D-alanyl-D-alanine-endopeptidase [Bacteroidales bacterium]|nr:D-alanyl-D-alanine carboxypeptidase/D-alanyl-D-alanine-endopeptidase [Bacteroidales bacterium]